MEVITNKTPKELLLEAGYELYECKSEEDIQSFKKYYAKGEELCTFRGNRLDKCYVFFAVKKNVDKIKREDFTEPERQDLYGTSVISIQFTKKAPCTLSIKNRYNHIVNIPDATFSNNLDNIIPGLTKSFENEYGFIQTNKNNRFELKNYVQVVGKYYKYNYEIDNVYYCPDNIVIDNFDVKQYDKERYIVLDYFILDLKEKKLIFKIEDAFIDTIKDIDKINVIKINEEKEIHITPIEGEEIVIRLDKENKIISYTNNNVWKIGNDFLIFNKNLKELNLSNLRECGDGFLYSNKNLKELNLSNLRECGDDFLENNENLENLTLQNLKECGDYFLFNNKNLIEINLPNLKECGYGFLYSNKNLKEINLPNLEQCGNNFLENNENLENLTLQNLKECGYEFLRLNKKLKELNLPNLKQCRHSFLSHNEKLTEINLPSLEQCENYFLYSNENLTEINLPNLKEYDYCINSIILEYLEKNKVKTKI